MMSCLDGSNNTAARLATEIRACTACTELPLGARPLLQIGASARILIAGQAPGRRAHLSGRLFDDASGIRLRIWLGMDEETFRDPSLISIVPMGFCFPGSRSSGDLPPRPECAKLWRVRVMATLPNPALTIVIGRHAQNWHLPETAGLTLEDAMHRWKDHWPAKLLLPHPSPRNVSWFRRNAWFETELLPKLRSRVRYLLEG